MGQCTGERVGLVWVIRLEGSFITDQDAVLIEEAIANRRADVQCVVVNWSGIKNINSTSLGAAMKGAMDLAREGRRFRNCAFSDRAARIVRPFRRSFPWNYFETEELAVTACSAADSDPVRITPKK